MNRNSLRQGGALFARQAPRFLAAVYTVLWIAKSITALEIQAAASTVTTEDPWLECFAPARLLAERARFRCSSLRFGFFLLPFRFLSRFVRVLLLALFLILFTAFVAHFVILCY